jgi:hypothetical protein
MFRLRHLIAYIDLRTLCCARKVFQYFRTYLSKYGNLHLQETLLDTVEYQSEGQREINLSISALSILHQLILEGVRGCAHTCLSDRSETQQHPRQYCTKYKQVGRDWRFISTPWLGSSLPHAIAEASRVSGLSASRDLGRLDYLFISCTHLSDSPLT